MSSSEEVVHVMLSGEALAMRSGESVLETLERSGVAAASGCRAGTCCKCMLRADLPPPASQAGLRATLSQQGYFLACSARPTSDLVLIGGVAPEAVSTTVVRHRSLTPDVAQIVLAAPPGFDFYPGQYVDVLRPNISEALEPPVDAAPVARSYSLASLPSTGELELHVRRIDGGRVSPWLHQLSPGDPVAIRGPFGQCFYLPPQPASESSPDSNIRRLLLVGAGTGLAPLLGIARSALASNFSGAIDLIHGGLDPSRLYLRDELGELARSYPSLRLRYSVLRDATANEEEGPLDQLATRAAQEGSIAAGETRAFLCGDEGIVRKLQRALFLSGLASKEILADPFAPALT